MTDATNFLKMVDRVCDYVPVVSSVTNSVHLFYKCVVLPYMNSQDIKDNRYYEHIDKKSVVPCVLLLVPVIGNIVVAIYNLSKYAGGIKCSEKPNSLEERVQEIQRLSQPIQGSDGDKLVCFYSKGPTAFLGNFADCPKKLSLWGKQFRCAEGAFHWRKYWLYYERMRIPATRNLEEFVNSSGQEAFELSRRLMNKGLGVPDNWNRGVRDEVMWEILKVKFASGTEFRSLLDATQGAYLLEHRTEKAQDTYWSDGHNGTGRNMLGEMLMDIRDSTEHRNELSEFYKWFRGKAANYANESLKYKIW